MPGRIAARSIAMRPAQFLPGRRPVVLALCSGLVLPSAFARAAQEAPNALYAKSFASLDQGDVAMRQFLGQPLVLNFWASWCPPCVKEMPDLEALAQDHPQVGFVGLAVDSAVNVRRFIEKVQVSYPLLLSGHDGIAQMRDLGNRQGGLPFTVLFDAQGRPQRNILGQIHAAQLDGFIRSLAA